DKYFYDLTLKKGTLMIISYFPDVRLLVNNDQEKIIKGDEIFQMDLKQGKYQLTFKAETYPEKTKTIYMANQSTNIIILNDIFFKPDQITKTNQSKSSNR
ncbi:MAG: hypothetical protein KKH98_05835, partial [Spirochaetes bacterium]|nr:hypothetical protein [Spirochaetota bacterium]